MKQSSIFFLVVSTAISQIVLAADLKLETDQDKLSYSLGMMIGERVAKPYKDINYAILLEGIKDQHQGKETALPLKDANMILSDYHTKKINAESSKAKAAGQQYMAENANRDGVTVTDSGLQYEVLKTGDGAKPKATDTVTVHYVGTLLDGTEFDSSVKRGQPATFPLNRVIPGWTEGVQLMNTGSKYRFVIPSELGYGNQGAGAKIGPGETLVFEVELLSIDDTKK
ncbi:MAG: FKBP-type peptidyl-prolyl cis-trans isomerase [Gammaproteobacteria bacterium]|nr:FKBP-type peptidyl-prolyl cis-trans isomerase [Gammaproteobacteria bacterium]